MFSKKKLEIDQQAISTILSPGCVVEGNLKAPAFTRIDGQVTGDVTVDEGLILGEKGSIKGNIKTKQFVAYGIVEGDVNVESLEIRSTGKIKGDIHTQALQIEHGAVYNGNLHMEQAK